MAQARDDLIAYFGYGSLVNLNTLRTDYVSAYPATLRGWERVWLPRPKLAGSFAPVEGLAFLSARPNPASVIDGMIVIDRAASLPALDQREALYRRHRIDMAQLTLVSPAHEAATNLPLFMYVADVELADQPAPQILRSYLDAVFQGYLMHFGPDGVRRFINTTANFDLAITEDRDAPIYPRAVATTDEELSLFDQLLLRSA
ncbi:MAG: gamma-glutamylcyclotransferase [Ahrensia sp.]|nr:gamma-glutamylcyclotransferase [Ahrensia sp.]